MAEAEERTPRRHPNDPDVVAHQIKMAAVTMAQDEREALMGSIDRQLREIDANRRSA